MSVQYAWVTMLTKAMGEKLIARLVVKHGFKVSPLIESGPFTSNEGTVVCALQVETTGKEELEGDKVLEAIKEAMDHLNGSYSSCIVAKATGCTWVAGIMRFPEPEVEPALDRLIEEESDEEDEGDESEDEK